MSVNKSSITVIIEISVENLCQYLLSFVASLSGGDVKPMGQKKIN